jgi:hypothetical protein
MMLIPKNFIFYSISDYNSRKNRSSCNLGNASQDRNAMHMPPFGLHNIAAGSTPPVLEHSPTYLPTFSACFFFIIILHKNEISLQVSDA